MIFIWLRNKIKFKGTKQEGQIATFILLFVVVVILLAAIFINIAKVAQKRVSVANAATGAVLQLSSSLGSYAHMLSCKYLNCKDKRCKFSFLSLIMILVTIALVVAVAIIGPGAILAAMKTAISGGAVGLGGLAKIAVGVATISSIVGTTLKFAVFDPKMYSAMNRAFRKMEPSMQISENAIRYAFLNTVDDPSKVADMQDLDMDGKYGFDSEAKPEDLINRFYYKYTQRLMWLIDSGPGPDGSYLGYKTRVKKILDDFLPKLKEFNDKSYTLSQYIGALPHPNIPAGIAPPHPNRIDSLYSLFAYLQEREYPYTKNELYHLSYHIDKGTGEPVNIWTKGFVECPDEDECDPVTGECGHSSENEDANLLCYHSPENDELDALGFALDTFNHPYNKRSEELTGFAPAILISSKEEQIATFDSWWYYELYNECADEPEPEKGQPCKNLDYEDYYDQIWELPDNSNTEFLVEKGWHQTIEGWLERLSKISQDIKNRIRRVGFDLAEYNRLNGLFDKIGDARLKLQTFKEDIVKFQQAIEGLRDDYDGLNKDPFSGSGNEQDLLYSRNSPVYTWRDSLGKHSVKIEVGPFKLARLKSYRKGCCKKCVKLKNKSGTVWIRITREDEPTTAKLPGGRSLWKFQYPTSSYTAKASYSYKAAPPVFLGIEKNR